MTAQSDIVYYKTKNIQKSAKKYFSKQFTANLVKFFLITLWEVRTTKTVDRYLNITKNLDVLNTFLADNELSSYLNIAPESLSRIRKNI